SLFSSYLDRIPFVLLVGIATSVEIFHDKLPKSTIRLMRGNKFDVERAEECLAQIFNDSMTSDEAVLRLGASVCDFLLERYRDHMKDKLQKCTICERMNNMFGVIRTDIFIYKKFIVYITMIELVLVFGSFIFNYLNNSYRYNIQNKQAFITNGKPHAQTPAT